MLLLLFVRSPKKKEKKKTPVYLEPREDVKQKRGRFEISEGGRWVGVSQTFTQASALLFYFTLFSDFYMLYDNLALTTSAA